MIRKRSSQRSILGFLTVVLLIVFYLIFPEGQITLLTPTPIATTPAVLSGQVTPTVSIGNPIKTTGCKSDGILPDRECTPGAIDPDVSQQMINGTICIVGYTDSVRPPSSETNKIKEMQLAAYGFPDIKSDYELDHLISLELGGCADCVSNLWPEPYNITLGARQKDKIENYLHKAVCNGEMTLAEAQYPIATDWTAVYFRVYGK